MNTVNSNERDAFREFWRDFGTFRWTQLLPHAAWVGGLALIAVTSRLLDPDARFIVPTIIGAVAWVILYPTIGIRRYHRKNARFIRCPACGDWFGRDISGAYHGPNPKFKEVLKTGCCVACGHVILPPPNS